jgi:hydroxymethylglutaryl-CoA reductase (NADPH)
LRPFTECHRCCFSCGQDAANVAESFAAISIIDVDSEGNYSFAMIIPSFIFAIRGGGKVLATQKECFELMDCFGEGQVKKRAEITGTTVLAGELSISAAVLAGDWVSSYDNFWRSC